MLSATEMEQALNQEYPDDEPDDDGTQVVFHTNHGGHPVLEEDIPEILEDAYRASGLEAGDDSPEGELHRESPYSGYDTSAWPQELKLLVLSAAAMSWYPKDGDMSSEWKDSHQDFAVSLFKDDPELMMVFTHPPEAVAAAWTERHGAGTDN